MKDFKGKVAVITGAASGIGFALAERCAQEGMKVVLAGINEDTLEKAEKEIKKAGVATLVVKTDVSKAADVEALANKTIEKFGAVHLLFNNAGVFSFTNTWESTLADWEWTLNVNLWSVIFGVHFFVPIMLKQGTECHIINTASSASLAANPYMSCYGVSKHGVLALTEALYHEVAIKTDKIHVSILIPGYTATNVLNAERNRPVHLANRPGEGMDISPPKVQKLLKFMEDGFQGAPQPVTIADIAFKGIQENKLYILATNDFLIPVMRERMEDIFEQRNPQPITRFLD
jgi:NAD(P)-dependent dehydrogenase (short-subunit alcohol dehydrogenase family)